MGLNIGSQAGIQGTLISFLADGNPVNAQQAFNFKVTAHTGGISWPKIDRRGRGDGASATATISGGAVTGSNSLVGGFGYNSAGVTVIGVGTGATFTATVVGGVVTALTLEAGGSGYTVAPAIVISETSGATPRTRLGDIDGGGDITLEYQPGPGFPVPILPQYATGTIRFVALIQSTATPVNYFDAPARIENITWGLVEGKTDLYRGTGKWHLAGNFAIAWMGNQITISAPTANDVNTYVGSTKSYDPNNLQTTATTRYDCQIVANSNTLELAKLASLALSISAPFPFAKIVSMQMERTNSDGIAVVTHWDYKSTVDQVNLPATSSLRSAIQAYRDAVSSVFASTDTDVNAANSQWAILQGTLNLLNIQVRSLTPEYKQLIQNFVNPGIAVIGLSMGGGRNVFARINSGAIELYVRPTVEGNAALGSGYRSIIFEPTWIIDVVRRRFIVTRTFNGATIADTGSVLIYTNGSPGGITVTFPDFGATNNSSFLGLGAGTVLYEGCSFSTNIGLSGVLTQFLAYHFSYDANGFFSQVPPSLYGRPTAIVTGVTSTGWQPQSSFSWPGGAPIQQPTQESFAAFLTA